MAPCPICAVPTVPVGTKVGRWSGRTFEIVRCPACHLVRVENPWTAYDEIYGDDYYAGRGADPLVDYEHEIAHRDSTIRRYEWRGIVDAVRRVGAVAPGVRWLDYGCGTGGLVLHLREAEQVDASGFEEGWSLPRLRTRGIPVLDRQELARAEGGFDVVTAIEVIEHVADPVAELRRMAALLRPGGVLFVTTGNARPHRDDILSWPYLIPEIHISLFEPATLAEAMRRASLTPEFPGYGPGWVDIIRFKALKNLRRSDISALERIVPWRPVARVLDRRLEISSHPVGRRAVRPAAPVSAGTEATIPTS